MEMEMEIGFNSSSSISISISSSISSSNQINEFSGFTFRNESVFLRKKYNFGYLPSSFIRRAFNIAYDYDSSKGDDGDPDGDVDMAATTTAVAASTDIDKRIAAKAKMLCEMSRVSKGWYGALQTTEMWSECIVHEINRSFEITKSALDILSDDENFDGISRADRERFSLLKETLIEAHKYLNSQSKNCGWKDVRTPALSYALLKNFRKTIESAYATCKAIFSHIREITCNFDSLELTLRKGMYELYSMLPMDIGTDSQGANDPLTNKSDPRIESVITDPDACNAWKLRMRTTRACVDFRTFYRKVILKDFPCALNESFSKLLSYHLNFPVSDIVTVYRFRTLISEFGPYKRFAENFERYAMRPGFVGFMNTVKAEEILLMHYKRTSEEKKRSTVLIRYSRKRPDVLAFTSLDVKRRRIEHRRNTHRDGTPIPIDTFIEQHFSGYDLLPVFIDDEIVKCPNIFNFANINTPYFRYIE